MDVHSVLRCVILISFEILKFVLRTEFCEKSRVCLDLYLNWRLKSKDR